MMSNDIRVLVAEWPSNQFFNLAFEEAFYRASDKPTMRFWRNDKVVVIGRLQSPVLEVNALEALRYGVKLVRRFTGGGAVYHDLGNLNYAIVLPYADMNIEEAFKLVGEVIVEALKTLGLEKAYYRPLNDIEVDGLKISGLAATRSHDRVFVHGAMLVSSNIELLWRVLKISSEKLIDKKLTQSRVKRVITIREALGRSIDPGEVQEAITSALQRKLGLKPLNSDLSKKELEQAVKLYWEKYSRSEWNLAFTEELRNLLTSEEYNALRLISKPSPQQDEIVRRLEEIINEP
jgi:lipoate-protein ligase A